MPTVFGVLLVVSTILGRVFLGERVPVRSASAIVLVIVALIFWSAGACPSTTCRVSWMDPGLWVAAGGIGLALVAGVSYAVSTVVIRRAMAAGVAPCTVVFLVTATGLATLGPWGLWRLGVEDLLTTVPLNLALMFGGGVFNLIGFVAFTTGLSQTNVVSANTLNASQVAASSVLGVFLFAEPASPLLMLGLTLNVVGMLCVGPPTPGDSIDK